MNEMKSMFTTSIKTAALISFLLYSSTFLSVAADSPELTKLQGTWNAKVTSDEGKEVHHVLEIKGDKLTFKLLSANHELRIFAKGSVRTERLGAFNVLQISDLQAGASEDQTDAINDDRSTIYSLDDGNFILASNFDKQRDGQKPTATTYTRSLAAKETGQSMDKVIGKWKMKIKMDDKDRDYDLELTATEGKLAGSVKSSRSGEHKLKSASFVDGKLSMELVREIQGNDATILYLGTLVGDQLTGTFSIKGFEDQYKGTWIGVK